MDIKTENILTSLFIYCDKKLRFAAKQEHTYYTGQASAYGDIQGWITKVLDELTEVEK